MLVFGASVDAYARCGGKVFKAFKGLTKQIGIKSIEKQLLKEAKRVAKGGKNVVTKTGIQFSKHSLEQLAHRGVTKDMAELAIRKGQKFYDPLNRSINYVLPNGFASSKSLLVGTNPLTGEVTTVIRSSKNLVNSRFIQIK